MAEKSGSRRMAAARVPGGGARCRINALPDDALLHVISFLNARQAVRTCVLSRRWRHLWRSVARINASYEEFDGMADTDEECNALFKKFISRFLILRNPTALDEFRLRYSIPDDDSIDSVHQLEAESADANLWINHALQWNARSVKVSEWGLKLHLDPAVFTSNYLISLKLSNAILFPGFFRNIQTGCTKLERLILRGCAINDIEISSQTLKVLTIDIHCHFTFDGWASISAPSLIYFGFFGDGKIPLLNNMESLETASVSVGTNHIVVDDIHQFLGSLSGVTNLDFYYQGKMLKMEHNSHWCPKFNNLTILTLGDWCLCADFYALIVFLQNSPNLVKLTLEFELSPDTGKKFIGELEERSFTCDHLKIVEIVCSEDLEDDPVVKNLENFLLGSGISPDQIDIINWC
ncbi:putative F-box/FBD/LRR-repeat protein At1g78760 isoform X2 [Phragmites australis]|uniref:putative F-box/FBD/LRR-repeat protein At1g78760 isoform X2 n=1 Tax=Phragmites australis TaxID=29695 RepID=UPI002D79EE6C|nr:putative F-box/FBD/LRR-repeat protein At1g78760 isoform X2 [Phragmites australis]